MLPLRRATFAMTVAFAICTAMALTACADPDGGFPEVPPTTPAPSIDTVDWANGVVQIPSNQTGCEAGQARFAQGRAMVGGTPYHMFIDWAPTPLYTDFDHDGRLDAVIVVSCVRTSGLRNPPSLVLAISGAADRHTMGTLFSSKPRNPDGEGDSRAVQLHLEEDGAVRYIDRTYEGNLGCEIEWTWMSGDFIHRSVDDSPACR